MNYVRDDCNFSKILPEYCVWECVEWDVIENLTKDEQLTMKGEKDG